MKHNVKFIFNPIANLGRAWPVAAALRPLADEFGGADWSGTVYPTHATELAVQAAEQGYEMIVALGGDGTVHEVINGLMQLPPERRPKLGIVPVGSGNDFAGALGIPTNTEQALRKALSGSPRPVDVASVSDGEGRLEYWNNTLGIGFDTVVNIRSRKVPLVQGFAVYFAAVLQTILLNYTPFRISFATDQERWDAELMMLVLCNGPREGGGFRVAPQASPFDGLLQYTGVRTISRPRMLLTISDFLKGTQARLPYVCGGTFRQLDLTADRPLHVHIDGEVFAGFGSRTRKLVVQVHPGAVSVML